MMTCGGNCICCGCLGMLGYANGQLPRNQTSLSRFPNCHIITPNAPAQLADLLCRPIG